MPTLVIDPAKSGPQISGAKSFSVSKKITSIGSGATNDVVLSDSDVAPNHAVLQFDGSNFQLQSTERKNEFYVNGKKKRKAALQEGDELQFGNTTLRFSILHQRTQRAADPSAAAQLLGFQRLHELS